MFWGTRATNLSIYTTKMEGAEPKILGTGAKFKQVPCQKKYRVNRAEEVGLTGAGAIAVTDVHFTESLCLPCMF